MNKKFVMSQELAQSILDYLASQPYVQVFKLIQAFQEQLKPADEAEETNTDQNKVA